jgi:hypothetical protein
MEWFKHDTDASTDAKIRKLIMRHGAVGYAVYFHCLELIMADVNKDNITFQLEHDAEIIADNLKINGNGMEAGVDIVNKIMLTIIDLRLFESNSNRITCLKLMSRLDSSMTSNTKFRKSITDLKATKTALLATSHDTVMIPSGNRHDTVMQEQEGETDYINLEQNLEEDYKEKNTKKKNVPYSPSSKNVITIPNNISSELHDKIVEFVSYRKSISKPIQTNRPILDLIEKIGVDFVNEIHLIQCMDFTMSKEWKHVNSEYVEYKHITNPDVYNERKRANESPDDYKPIGSLTEELARKVNQ